MARSGRLHKSARSWSLSFLCNEVGALLIEGRPDQKIDTVSSLDTPVNGALVLLTQKKYIPRLSNISGLVCLTSAELVDTIKDNLDVPIILVAERPRAAFARIAQMMFPESLPTPSIDESAKIHPAAIIDETAHIGAFVVIGPNCHIGAGCSIGASSVLDKDVHLGAGSIIGTHNFLTHLHSAEALKTASHCSIGKRGFGFEGQGSEAQFLSHLGRVVIGKGCDISAGVTIDRGVLDDTIIGDYVMIDNQCHIAHNVIIGSNTIILGQTGIAGSAVIGKGCILGGQVGIGDHITLADDIVVASKSGVTKDLSEAGTYAGFPAIPARDFWMQIASLRRKSKTTKSS